MLDNKQEDYFSIKALSNSFLKSLRNPALAKQKLDNPNIDEGDNQRFIVGSAVDCLLTAPRDFYDKYMVSNTEKPAGLMCKFIDNLPKGITILSDEYEYENAYIKSGYKLPIGKIIDKFWSSKEYVSYYSLRTLSDNTKTIISSKDLEKIQNAVSAIKNNSFIEDGYYFSHNSLENTDGMIEVLFQVAIYFKYMELDCKALLDGVVINHESKTIRPYDLKTTSEPVEDFKTSFLKLGYYIQCAFYELALCSEQSPIKHLLDNGYKLLDFEFIVAPTRKDSFALIYIVDKSFIYMGLSGGVVDGTYYKGIINYIEDYKYHIETNNWTMPADYLKNEGKKILYYANTR